MRKVLVVDDDSHIRDVVSFALRRSGFDVSEAADGEAALTRIERDRPDLVILDILMPEMDGLDVCRAVRGGSAGDPNVPILFLSSKDAEIDRVVGLELGADDYVTKPFSPRELVARVKAHFRRGDNLAEPERNEIVVGQLRMELDAQRAAIGGQQMELTRTEFGLLATLARYAGKVLNREALMNGAYVGFRIVSDRTIDSHMRRLRAKLRNAGGFDPIETVHGVGFRLSLADEPSRRKFTRCNPLITLDWQFCGSARPAGCRAGIVVPRFMQIDAM